MAKKLLLHTCCAPCTISSLQGLSDWETIAFLWFNPNIHPFTEYRNRKNALLDFAKENNFEVIVKDIYGLREFIRETAQDIDNRCDFCYSTRMDMAAKTAKELNYDYFSTTLLTSPYQNHEKIIEICNQKSQEYSVNFFYRDLRPSFRSGQSIARESGVYMQKYCGCIFSEEERYVR